MGRSAFWDAWLWLCLLVMVWTNVAYCRKEHQFVEWEELEKAENEDSPIRLRELFKRYAFATHRKKLHKPISIFGEDEHVRHRKILDYQKKDVPGTGTLPSDHDDSGTASGNVGVSNHLPEEFSITSKGAEMYSGDSESHHGKTSNEGEGAIEHTVLEGSGEIALIGGQKSSHSDIDYRLNEHFNSAATAMYASRHFNSGLSNYQKKTTRNKISTLVSRTDPSADTSVRARHSTTHYTPLKERHSTTHYTPMKERHSTTHYAQVRERHSTTHYTPLKPRHSTTHDTPMKPSHSTAHDTSSLVEESTITITNDALLINDRSTRLNGDRDKLIMASPSTHYSTRKIGQNTVRGIRGRQEDMSKSHHARTTSFLNTSDGVLHNKGTSVTVPPDTTLEHSTTTVDRHNNNKNNNNNGGNRVATHSNPDDGIASQRTLEFNAYSSGWSTADTQNNEEINYVGESEYGTAHKHNSIENHHSLQTTDKNEQPKPDKTTKEINVENSNGDIFKMATYPGLSQSSSKDELLTTRHDLLTMPEDYKSQLTLSSQTHDPIPNLISINTEPPTLAFSSYDHQNMATSPIETVKGIPEIFPTITEDLSKTTFHFTSDVYHLFETTQSKIRVKRTTKKRRSNRQRKITTSNDILTHADTSDQKSLKNELVDDDEVTQINQKISRGVVTKTAPIATTTKPIATTTKPIATTTTIPIVTTTIPIVTTTIPMTTKKALAAWNVPCSGVNSCQEGLVCSVGKRSALLCACPKNTAYSKRLGKCKPNKYWTDLTWKITQHMENKTVSVEWIFKSPEASNDVNGYTVKYSSCSKKFSVFIRGNTTRENHYTFKDLKVGRPCDARVRLTLESEEVLISKKNFILCYDSLINNIEVKSFVNNTFQVNYNQLDGCVKNVTVDITDSDRNMMSTTQVPGSRCLSNPENVSKNVDPQMSLKKGSSYSVVIKLESYCVKTHDASEYPAEFHTYPAAPDGLKIIERDTRYLRISWKRPTEGSVDAYRIEVKEAYKGSKVLNTIPVPSNQTWYDITGLEKGKTYKIAVYSVYKNKEAEADLLAVIAKYVPAMPLQVKWIRKNNLLRWKCKDVEYGKTEFSRLRYDCRMTGNNSMDVKTEIVSLPSILDDECCSISVVGVNAIGESDSNDIKKHPYIEKNSNPIEDIDNKCYGDKAETSWALTETTLPGTIYRFNVTVWEEGTVIEDQNWECKGKKCIVPCDYQVKNSIKIFSPVQKRFHLSFPIQPAKTYQVRVKPVMVTDTDVREINFTSPEAPPSSPVLNVSVSITTPSTVSIRWIPPIQSNGNITKYNISIQYFSQNCSEVLSSDKYYHRESTYRILKASPLIHVLDKLLPFTNYTISMAGINNGGQSKNWSNPVSFTTRYKRVTAQFRHLTKSFGARFVQISWELPCPLTEPIESYIIDVYHIGQDDVDQDQMTSNTSIVISDLRPDTRYKIRICGQSTNISSEFTFTTMIDIPGPVDNLKLTQEEQPDKYRRLFINWNAPRITNGIITGYNVTVETHCPRSERKAVNTNETSLTLPAHPECRYNVKVFASTNAGSGPMKEKDICIKAGVLPSPVETTTQPLVHLGDRCSQEDATRSVPLNLPKAFLCNSSFGRIIYRGVLVIKEDEREKVTKEPIVVLQPNVILGEPASSRWHCPGALSHPQSGFNGPKLPWRVIFLPDKAVTCVGGMKNPREQCGKTIPQGVERFVVGKLMKCQTHGCNQLLESGTRYRFMVIVCTSAGCTLSLQSRIIQTEATKADSNGLVYGVLVFIVIVILLLILAGVVYKYRDKARQIKSRLLNRLNGTSQEPAQAVEMDSSGGPSRSQHMPKENVEIVDMEPGEVPTKPIQLADFVGHVNRMHLDSNMMFSEEYKLVTKSSHKYDSSIAGLAAHRIKNRYTNILPFDHARVKILPLDDDEPSDYINASFIPGCRGPREYIATQGPLKTTLDDFWRMIWEKKVTAVVMLTQCVEKGKDKCESYWPADTSTPSLFGDLRVSLKSESNLPDYVIRVIDLRIGVKSKTIHQFHFLKWPDFGCPDKTWLLLNLVAAVRDHTPRVPIGPMVVHCSAGVGRSGTYIALDMLLQQIKEKDRTEVDIFTLVMNMRKNRPFMVQQENQYAFIHDCVRDALMEELSGDEYSNHDDDPIYQNT